MTGLEFMHFKISYKLIKLYFQVWFFDAFSFVFCSLSVSLKILSFVLIVKVADTSNSSPSLKKFLPPSFFVTPFSHKNRINNKIAFNKSVHTEVFLATHHPADTDVFKTSSGRVKKVATSYDQTRRR